MALSLAHQAKQLFFRLRRRMKKPPSQDDLDSLDIGFTLHLDLDDQGFAKRVTVEAEPHETEAVNSAIRTVMESRGHRQPLPDASHPPERKLPKSDVATAPVSSSTRTAPLLSKVIEVFLLDYQKRQKVAMFKKHQPVLNMLLTVIGDKPVDQLLQQDITDFFALLPCLPPRWADKCRQLNVDVVELAQLDHDELIGPKTFKDTYLASVRPFLKAARLGFQDQGFPPLLTVEGIAYTGNRKVGERKQRAFKPEELKRLFEGPEIRRIADDPDLAHCYWLPHLGLFTGARVNELCQLNPQTDILRDEESGIWYLWITADTEADPRIVKSVKTGDSRMVPMHQKLLDLGFLQYVDRVKRGGAKLLFPNWKPVNKRASGDAEDWFRQFLRDLDLRDETPNACLTGMHAFRHTLLTYGAMQKPPLSLFNITGHAQDEIPIAAKGAGKGYLTRSLLSSLADRAAVLNQLDYQLDFARPSGR